MAKKMNAWIIVGAVVLAAFVLGFASYSQSSGLTVFGNKIGGSTQSVASAATTTSTSASGASCERPTGGNTATFGVKVVNGQNSTYQQVASTAALIGSDGTTAGSVSTTDAAAEAFASMTPLPCVEGYLYVLGDSSTNGERVVANTLKANQNVAVPGSQNSRLIFSLYTNTLAADNQTDASQGSVAINTTTHAIASGGSYTGYVDVDFQSASSAFGTVDGGGYIAVDHNLAVYSRENGVKIASTMGLGLTPVVCPADIATYLNADTCYHFDQLTSRGTATPNRLSVTLKADLGEPGATDDVKIYFVDEQYFRDTDAKVKLGAYSSAGTDQGVANGLVIFDVS